MRSSRRSQGHSSNKRRPDGDGMDSSVEDSGLELPAERHLTGGECQCACDHVVYSPTAYTCLQDERMFAPAPDVTRGMGSTINLSKPEPPGSPPYYRSTSVSSSNSVSSRGGLDLTPKHWWIIATVLLLAAAVGVGVPIALKISAGASFEERLEVASRLLQETPLIDGHNDLPWNIRKFMHNKLKNFKFDGDLREVSPWSSSAWSHTDLLRLERGHVTAQFWAAYVPCDSQYKDAVQLTLEQIDVIRRFTDWYHPRLVLCTSAEDIKTAHQNHHMCSLIGVEGGHSLAGSLAVLRTLYHVGVRYLTLTSTCNTPWADCSHVDMPGKKPEHGGLTTFGKAVIKEMNRLGMIVDLSHVSVGTMRDALDVSKAPVIFSHSSTHSLCNSTRNVADDTLRRLALNGGIIMVNFYSLFLTCRETATVADAVAHINHIREVAGVDNVGIGAGYDGINYVPQGLEDVSSYPTLFAELIGTGKWSVEDLKKLAGLNFLRVMQNVERIRDEFKRANVPPYEDVMPRPKGTSNCTSQANY
ncbi:dipeptidase 1-like [Euwallacea similis]|uniref:dipeptidase 1-like n=1 Tax=Euwallacea similis TaxID=1736056 RepID=UPI00344FD69B